MTDTPRQESTLRKWFRISELRFNWEVVAITIASTLILIVNYYYSITSSRTLDSLLIYLVVPMAIILIGFRQPLWKYGFTLGDWKAGLAITAAAIAVMAPIIWYLAHADPSMRAYYQWQMKPTMPLLVFLELAGWEFFFRGFILFGYEKEFGVHALWLQAVPFALAHISKPAVETLSTIFGGFAFGWLAWRTRSFIYPLIIHWFIMTFMIAAASGALG